MLKKDFILSMATALKMDKKAVEDAIADEKEVDLKLPEGVSVFTQAELTSREEQLKSTATRSAKEIVVKDLKEKAGLEYDGEGSKDPVRFISEYQKKVLAEANVKESDKVKELNTTIEGLRSNLTNLTNEKNNLIKTAKDAEIDNNILTWTIDKKPENLSNREWVTIIKLNNELVEENGQILVKRDGKIVANTTDLKPIPAKDALVSYIDERKIGKVEAGNPPAPGRNGGDSKSPLSGITNMKQFKEAMTSKGISLNSAQAQTELANITKDNKDFDFKTS